MHHQKQIIPGGWRCGAQDFAINHRRHSGACHRRRTSRQNSPQQNTRNHVRSGPRQKEYHTADAGATTLSDTIKSPRALVLQFRGTSQIPHL